MNTHGRYKTKVKPAVEVRKINPPKLAAKNLGQRFLCHRPMRHGHPRMEVEAIQGKIIIHNYGHGGSGWTLGPGSAKYVNALLENSKHAKDLKKDTPLTIIGAGALGLFTAYDLLSKGYRNITIIADKFEGLVSHNAGGLVSLVSMNNAPNMQEIINDIGVDSYKFFKKIAKKQNPIFKQGAAIISTYFKTRMDSGLELYVGKVMKPAKDVILDFGNGTKQKMVAYDDGIFIDTGLLMQALNAYLKPQVKFTKKKITKFNQVESKYIFNCTGLGARELAKDNKVVSVQGHLITLKGQNPKDLMYEILIYFGNGKTKNGQKISRAFYIFPKKLPNSANDDIGVIGGTFIEGATEQTPNEEEFEIMVKQAKDFYGIK